MNLWCDAVRPVTPDIVLLNFACVLPTRRHARRPSLAEAGVYSNGAFSTLKNIWARCLVVSLFFYIQFLSRRRVPRVFPPHRIRRPVRCTLPETVEQRTG